MKKELLYFIQFVLLSMISFCFSYATMIAQTVTYDLFQLALLTIAYFFFLLLCCIIYHYIRRYILYKTFLYARKFTSLLKYFEQKDRRKQSLWEFYLLALFFTGDIHQFKKQYALHMNEIQEQKNIYRYLLSILYRLIQACETDKVHISFFAQNQKQNDLFYKDLYLQFHSLENALQYYDKKQWKLAYDSLCRLFQYEEIEAKPLTFYTQLLFTKVQKYNDPDAFAQSLKHMLTLCFDEESKELLHHIFKKEYQRILEENTMSHNNKNYYEQDDQELQRTFTYHYPNLKTEDEADPVFTRTHHEPYAEHARQPESFIYQHDSQTSQDQTTNKEEDIFTSSWFLNEIQNTNDAENQENLAYSRTHHAVSSTVDKTDTDARSQTEASIASILSDSYPNAYEKTDKDDELPILSRKQYQKEKLLQKNQIQETQDAVLHEETIQKTFDIEPKQMSTFSQTNPIPKQKGMFFNDEQKIESTSTKTKSLNKMPKKMHNKKIATTDSKRYLRIQLRLFFMILCNSIIISFISSSIVYTSFFNRYSINSEIISEIVLLAFIVALFITYAAVSLHTGFTILYPRIKNYDKILKIILSPILAVVFLVIGIFAEIPYIIYHSIQVSHH